MNEFSSPSARPCLYAAAAAVILALSLQTAAAEDIISFNATGVSSGGMTSGDIAGALGVNVPNWNNMNTVQATGGGAIEGSLLTGGIIDDSGAVVSGLSLTWNGTGVANAGGAGINDQKMFESEWDLFDSASNTALVDMTFTLTGVPFALYDVYFYVQDASNAEIRGGDITANGFTESIRMFNFPENIPGGAYSYVEADNQFSYDPALSAQGTYVRIENVTGSRLDLTVSSKNTTVPRLRMSGFQIVAVPEPSTAAALLGGVGLLLGRRRRRA